MGYYSSIGFQSLVSFLSGGSIGQGVMGLSLKLGAGLNYANAIGSFAQKGFYLAANVLSPDYSSYGGIVDRKAPMPYPNLAIATLSDGRLQGHAWLIYTDASGISADFGLWHGTALDEGSSAYDGSEQSSHSSILGGASGFLGSIPFGISIGSSGGGSLGSSLGSSSNSSGNDYEQYRIQKGSDLYKNLERNFPKPMTVDYADSFSIPITRRQERLLLEIVNEKHDFKLYFGAYAPYNCSSWASETFHRVTGIDIDAHYFGGVESPWELSQTLRDREHKK